VYELCAADQPVGASEPPSPPLLPPSPPPSPLPPSPPLLLPPSPPPSRTPPSPASPPLLPLPLPLPELLLLELLLLLLLELLELLELPPSSPAASVPPVAGVDDELLQPAATARPRPIDAIRRTLLLRIGKTLSFEERDDTPAMETEGLLLWCDDQCNDREQLP
jgi:hypothetical protein